MSTRRNFLRSLGAGLALAMLPLLRERPPAVLEEAEARALLHDWITVERTTWCTTPEYDAALEQIVREARRTGRPLVFGQDDARDSRLRFPDVLSS